METRNCENDFGFFVIIILCNLSKKFMANLFSYVLRIDDGAAPNPFWKVCTLTICKPKIRKGAQKGDWIVGTGSKCYRFKDGKVKDLSRYLVYAMKVDKVLSLEKYDSYCQVNLKNKIPDFSKNRYERKIGDCIYKFENGKIIVREGVHTGDEKQNKADINGKNSLLSWQFYYFGDKAIKIPHTLRGMIKKGRAHKKIQDEAFIKEFESWITKNGELNKLVGEPIHKYYFDEGDKTCKVKCNKRETKKDLEGKEEIIKKLKPIC